MERILATVVAIGSGVLGTQALFAAVGSISAGVSPVRIALMVIVYVPLIAMLVACVIGRGCGCPLDRLPSSTWWLSRPGRSRWTRVITGHPTSHGCSSS